MSVRLSTEALEAMDAAIEEAVDRCDTSHLDILGYGEISAVVAWPPEEPTVACKRLPPFADEHSVRSYASCVDEYLEQLSDGGIEPLETDVQWLRHDDGRVIAYVVQPLQLESSMLHRQLASCSPNEAQAHFEDIMQRVAGCVSTMVGLDGQASNWLITATGLAYLDVSTPLLRESGGQERLDTDIFIASLPWVMRSIVRRFMLGSILDKYYDIRGIALDFMGNLHKEKLAALIPPLLAVANDHIAPPITEVEIAKYYRSDAMMWELLQRLRHIDRAWQRRVRRRQYPFLLPGKIERNV